jgi:thiol-disulfide isomerase/thioredoxin
VAAKGERDAWWIQLRASMLKSAGQLGGSVLRVLSYALAALVALAVIGLAGNGSGIARPWNRPALAGFALPELDGREWTASRQMGDVLVLNFWATWCPPCRAETPDLVKMANEYAPRGVSFAGVCLDGDNESAVRAFVQQQKIPYPILLSRGKTRFPVNVGTIPVTLLVDRQGRIAETFVGMISERALRGDLDRLLEEK